VKFGIEDLLMSVKIQICLKSDKNIGHFYLNTVMKLLNNTKENVLLHFHGTMVMWMCHSDTS